MRTIEIQFEHGGVVYSATAEFLDSRQTMIRVFEFYPSLPDYRKDVYFVYNADKKKMEFPFFGKKQKGFAETMFASICECCKDADILPEMGLGVNWIVRSTHAALPSLVPAA